MADDEASSNHATRFEAARREVSEHPATHLVGQMTTLRKSLDAVVIANYGELVSALQAPAADSTLAVELVQSVRRSIVAERYNNVLVQRLHNYLAGIFTLTEHVRAIMTRQPEALVARWAEQRKSRFGTSEVSFVGDLRRYIQHYAHLPIRQRWSFSGPAAQTQHSEFFVELDVHELREWHDWLAPSRHFLEGKESIELLPLVERHARVVVAGNRWLLQQLVALVVPLQDEYNELVVKANATLTGLDLEKARLLTEERTRQRFSLEEPRTT